MLKLGVRGGETMERRWRNCGLRGFNIVPLFSGPGSQNPSKSRDSSGALIAKVFWLLFSKRNGFRIRFP
jgi:hypothetical protein